MFAWVDHEAMNPQGRPLFSAWLHEFEVLPSGYFVVACRQARNW